MKKTLYVHIGTTKTGTTAVQSFCIDNQEVLNQKGYCYPLFPYSYKDVSERRNAHFLIAEASERSSGRFREGMDRILDLFQKYHSIILSDEGIWSSAYEQRINMWRALKAEAKEAGFKVKVIVYLRRQDTYLISGWNQMVKSGIGNGADKPWNDYVQDLVSINKMKYATHLKKIAAFWGEKNIIVRRFEPKHFKGGSVYSDFLDTVGLELTDEYHIEQSLRNTRLAGNTHEIQRVLNGMPEMNPVYHSFFRRALLTYADLSGEKYPCEMFSKEEAEAFLKNYEEGNRKVAEEYLHEPGGELFDLTVKDTEKWQKNNRYMDEDLARFTASVGVYLQKEYEDLKKENDALKKEVNRLKRDVEELFQFRENAKHPFRTMLSHIKRRFKKGN